MPTRPDAVRATLLTAVARRVRVRSVLDALAWGSLAMAVATAVALLANASPRTALASSLIVGSSIACALAWRSRATSSRRAAAREIERSVPSARNLVITYEELERHPERAAAWMRTVVLAQAEAATSTWSAARVVPSTRLMAPAMITVALSVATGLMVADRAPSGALATLADAVARVVQPAAAATVTVTVRPPAYAGLEPQVLRDPERIDALEGSRIEFQTPPESRVRFGDRVLSDPLPVWLARDSGYFAVERPSGERRLIALAVRPDQVPLVRIEAPAKDLLLSDGSRTIPITIVATDDHALQSLELRYTRVTGSGEQFEFVEGSIPVRLDRRTDRDWRASASLALPAMSLEPGDSLVYQAVSRDRRPGDGGEGTSDTYFVEIAGPGQVVFEGVEMLSELDRYAMSQQMIVLELERLRARERSMSRAALAEEAASLAAQQRTVRANFIFLLGGHIEDEEEEAEQSHEIQEGRLENTARRDIDTAIGHMTRAEQGLTAIDTGAALPPARAAVESLQRAFGRSRYLLRSLATRSRLDPARRLTGDTAGASDWRRIPSAGDRDDPRQRPLALLSTLHALASSAQSGSPSDPADFDRAAEAALSIDPVSPLWQEVSRHLVEAGRSAINDPAAVAARIERAMLPVRAELQRLSLPRVAPAPSSSLERAYRSQDAR